MTSDEQDYVPRDRDERETRDERIRRLIAEARERLRGGEAS